MRFVALLLTLSVAGPSVGALVCDWTCAVERQAAAATDSNCHDAPGPVQTAAFAAGHQCHELPAPAASVVTCATQVVDSQMTVDAATAHEIISVQPSFVMRRPGRSHAPPPTHLVPLRI